MEWLIGFGIALLLLVPPCWICHVRVRRRMREFEQRRAEIRARIDRGCRRTDGKIL